MKKITFFLIFLASFTRPVSSDAQSDWFFNIYGGSTNMWSNIYLQLPANIINSYISDALDDEDGFGGALRYEFFNIKNAGDKVSIDRGSYWGFKSKDMFSNVQYGLKFGWQPELSPFGIYVSCAYQFKKFSAQFDSEVDEWHKYKMHSVRPGIGIRITPFINMLEDRGWSPILEVGTSYNYYFSCKAPYENDKKQFNSGMISTFAIGARFEDNLSISGGVELDHYS
ncbi:MAG: hypothetical protein J5996_00970, partial [Prevotella sp.]|nr:hypothetical protein [Prevotella sp.]